MTVPALQLAPCPATALPINRCAPCLPSAGMAPSDPVEPVVPDPDPNPAGDAELLRRFCAGEREAFARLYDSHDRHCFNFIRRMLTSADEATAEDVHQEVWLSVARQAVTFDEHKARFVTWLFTIASNKVMDHFRKAHGVVHLAGDLGEHAVDLGDELPDLPDRAEVDPERIAHNRQLAAALLQAVQALPLVQREAFVLFAQHELSLQEVAEITRVGLQTCKSRLRYARQTLRQRLVTWTTDHA